MGFKDHFSGHASDYTRYRPGYPRALFAWLARQAPGHELAWDCATGNGQAAMGLAEFFDTVVATDASAAQIAAAQPHVRVRYEVAPAEHAPLPAHRADLITVGQALHWFDFPAFYAEVARLLKPGGVLAAWSYGLMQVSPSIDAVVWRLYEPITGAYWPPERRYVEEQYRTVPFPLDEIDTPSFAMEAQWTLEQMLGYLGTWSAVQRYRKECGDDPLRMIADELAAVWGNADVVRRVVWPLYMRAGRFNSTGRG